MKFYNLVKNLHLSFAVINILCMLVVDYHYLNYCILISSLILLGWILNKSCFMGEYENFIHCSYDNTNESCKTINKNNRMLEFHIDVFTLEWSILIVGISISLIRMYYHYNFFSFSNDHVFNGVLLGSFVISINLLFILLLVPSINYYNQFKNKKIMVLYVTYFIISIVCSFNYFFIQDHSFLNLSSV